MSWIFDDDREIYSINFENLPRDIGIGALIGFLFIGLNILNPNIAIGIPLVTGLSVAGAWFVAVLLAPIFEEGLFSGVIFNGANYFLNWPIAIFLRSVLFMIFHLVVYGASLQGLPTAFLAAFLFSTLVGIVTRYTESASSGVVTHMMFNAFLGLSKLVVVGV